jgi:hypothetical protein
MVVFKTESTNETNEPTMRDYYLNFTDGYGTVPLFRATGFVPVLIHGPGVVLRTISSDVVGSNVQGAHTEFPVNLTLPYAPGRIVFADFVAVETIKLVGDHSFTTKLDLRKITKEDRDQILVKISGEPEFKSWESDAEPTTASEPAEKAADVQP